MGVAYEGEFVAPDFTYFPDLFFPPFFTNAPGLVGAKYLRSPIDPATGEQVGLTMFTVHENPSSPGVQFRDMFGVQNLWRVLSGNVNPGLGDDPCTFPDPKARNLCFLAQEPKDTRFLQASGPFSLDPGESATVVVAQFAAATVETGLIVPGNAADNPPGVPSKRPGCGGVGEEIRPIEVGAGWIANQPEACTETSGKIDQFRAVVVPGSLLGKALVAQTIFDNKFLLGFAPEPPDFFLVPGDNSVTVIWEPSATEVIGDPFFSAAGDSTNALFNPNYREFDVEGYQIYRGTDPSDLQLIAQFDYSDTRFGDSTCETDPTFVAGDVCMTTTEVDIIAPFVQYPLGGVVRLQDGSPFVTDADTALAEEGRAFTAKPLANTGVPFAFVDDGAVSGFQYFYKVTAFDINSLASGPTSLASSAAFKTTFPRAASPNQVLASLNTSISGDDGVPLDAMAPLPTIDPDAGTFSGPMPPSDAYALGFAPLIERLLPKFRLTARVDSIVVIASGAVAGGTQEFPTANCPEIPGTGGRAASPFGACWAMYLTVDSDGALSQEVIRGYNPWWSAFGEPADVDIIGLRSDVPFDSTSLEAFGIPQGFSSSAAWDAVTGEALNNSTAQGPQSRRFGSFNGGSRWFDGPNESFPDPTQNIRVGHLDAVDTVWAPISHTPLTPGGDPVPNSIAFEKQCFNRGLAFLGRAADVEFTWGGGTLSSVRDVTHNVDVPFSPKAGPTWGFLVDDSNGNGMLDWQDFNYIDRAHQILRQVDGGNCDAEGGGRWDPADAFTPVDLASTPQLMATSTAGLDVAGVGSLPQTGVGFGLFAYGERYIFETSSLPGDGTVWTLRSYTGSIGTADESAVDPTGYVFENNATGAGSRLRALLIPGLAFNYEAEDATQFVGKPDLKMVHTVPDPYYAVSNFDLGPATKRLQFVNLPPRATIRIYSVSGVLVDVINHNDASGGGQTTWDLRNRSNQFVASGVYFFHVVTPEGDEHVGKFTIINFAN